MAVLRLIVAGTAWWLAACDQAGAAPSSATSGRASSELQAPAGWQALPELGQAVGAAATAEGVIIDGTEAWGETSIGCYGAWIKLHGAGATSDEVIKGLEHANLGVRDIVKPQVGEDGLIAMTFERAPYRGRLRVRVATEVITALACFANDREPTSCDQPCTMLLGGLP